MLILSGDFMGTKHILLSASIFSADASSSQHNLISDNDRKFGPCFARVATTSAIEILNTPSHAPRANAICERFLRSVRQECLDHLLILHEKQHEPRAKSGMSPPSIGHGRIKGSGVPLPEPPGGHLSPDHDCGTVISFAILGGLHHDYRKGA
jgi:putative transposase